MKNIIIIATGPSVTLDQVRECLLARQLGRTHLMGISDTYSIFGDNLDHMYSCDPAWWDYHIKWVSHVEAVKWTQCKTSAESYNLRHIPGGNGEGLSTKANFIHYGSNSGFQALNLAYLIGYRRIILLGYDMRVDKGKAHFFGDHPGKLNRNSSYGNFAKRFELASKQQKQLELEIINCSPGSALNCFTKMNLTEALK